MTGVRVEGLERRRLASIVPAGEEAQNVLPWHDPDAPILNAVRFVGPPGQATALTLTFSKPLDPVGATDVRGYEVNTAWRNPSPVPPSHQTPLASASYDDATRTVTLVPQTVPFDAAVAVRLVTVHAWAVRSPGGTQLDGDFDLFSDNNDAIVPLRYFSKRSINYADRNGSRVRLRVSGPGRLRMAQAVETFIPEDWGDGWGHSDIVVGPRKFTRTGEAQQLWVDGATADTIVTGIIKPRRRNDNRTTFAEVLNPGGARLDLLNNPAFRVAL
jgi:hypothetical protein